MYAINRRVKLKKKILEIAMITYTFCLGKEILVKNIIIAHVNCMIF